MSVDPIKNPLADNRRLGHKKPCAQCPFRRNSMRGYLGGYRLQTYAQPVAAGVPTSCHEKDYGAHDENTRFCAGALQTIQKDDRVPKHEVYASAVNGVVSGPVTFDSVGEFQEHHAAVNSVFCEEFKTLTGRTKEEDAPTP